MPLMNKFHVFVIVNKALYFPYSSTYRVYYLKKYLNIFNFQISRLRWLIKNQFKSTCIFLVVNCKLERLHVCRANNMITHKINKAGGV